MHAAGVIMSNEPLLDHVPVWKREADGAIITQFDYPSCEDLGLLKMDFLGLRNLTILDDALAGHQGEPGRRPSTSRRCRWTTSPPMSCSPAATRSACSSSRAARCGRCCGPCGADRFDDISAVNALYRPGPMGANAHNDYADRKTGRKPVVPIHPELAEPLADILGDTYGLLVYQEQVLLMRAEAGRLLARQG